MDVISPIEPTASNGHRFILVAIDYFTKWVEAGSYKAMNKKIIADFIRDRIVCQFGVPESIITVNAANINCDLMKAMCKTFKIKHRNSTTYRPQMNGAVEASNKNIKKIFKKIVDNYNCYTHQGGDSFPKNHTGGRATRYGMDTEPVTREVTVLQMGAILALVSVHNVHILRLSQT
nr:uncharacterized protein K02A2.6-like [Nicotiana tomentosiformis]